MVSKNDPGEVYFIHTIDQVSGESHGYYKIGIVRNERDSEQRIKEHQTGNPHRIVPYKILTTKAPMLIEGMLHAKYSKHQVSTEWFKFEDEIIDEVIAEAERLDEEHGEAVANMSKHYRVTASKPELVLTGDDLDKAKRLRDEAYDIEKDLKKHYFLMKKSEHELEKLTDNHGNGIRGVSIVTITPAKNEFNLAKWWSKATEDQKKRAGLPQKPANDFTLLYSQNNHKKATDGYWKKTHSKESKDADDAKMSIPGHKPEDFNDTSLERTEEIITLHKNYCDEKGKHDGKKKELEAKIIQLMVMCGEHKGIKDICSWEREQPVALKVNESLMKKNFGEDLTDTTYFKETKIKSSIKVHPFRPYA